MGRLLTAKETAQRLQMSEEWVYRAAALGILPSLKIGRSLRFVPEKIAEWLDRQSVKAGLKGT